MKAWEVGGIRAACGQACAAWGDGRREERLGGSVRPGQADAACSAFRALAVKSLHGDLARRVELQPRAVLTKHAQSDWQPQPDVDEGRAVVLEADVVAGERAPHVA